MFAQDLVKARVRCCRLAVCFAALVAIGAAAPGYAAQGQPPNPSGVHIDAAQLDTPASQRRASGEYHVLAGEMAIQRGQRAAAVRQYMDALQYSNDPAVAERAFRIAAYANKPNLAYKAARVWADGRPKSLDAQRAATQLALATGDRAGMQRYAPALVAAAPSVAKGYQMLTGILVGVPDQADLAVKSMHEIAAAHPQSAEAHYALGVVALNYSRLQMAESAVARARELRPDWNAAGLLQADVWIHQGQTAKAHKLVADLPGDQATRAHYHIALAHLLVQTNQDAAARDEFAAALKLQPKNTDARYGVAVLSLSLGDLTRAQSAFEWLYKDGQHTNEAAYYLGSIHEQHRQYAKAQRWYQRVDSGNHVIGARVRAARMRYEQGDLAAARKQLAALRKRYPNVAGRIDDAEGQLLLEARRDQAALAVYDRALKQHPDDTNLYYGRSLAYERLGRIDAAEQDLQTMLARDGNDPRALNALGYMLTNHSHDYQRALGYIRKALHADPDNPAIQDSMGWVQYRLGHLNTARHYLEKAYKAQPGPEIAAHLGTVRWKLGEHDAARRIWRDALSKSPHDPVLRATMKRFGQ